MHHALPHLLPLLFLCFLLLSSSSCLTLQYTNSSSPNTTSTQEISSVYATIGELPSFNITYNNTVIVGPDDCYFEGVEGKVVVFTGDLLFSMFSECNNAHQANAVVAARVAQKSGAAAVILRAFDKFEGGRAVGFTSSIHIPVLVIPFKAIKVFLDPDLSNFTLVFPSASSKEKGQIHYLQRLWLTWKACTSLIFGFLLILCCYLFYMDILKFVKRGYTPSTNLVMKGISVYSMLVSLLWTSVDPFGFLGVLWWKNSLLINLQFSSVVIVFTLILLMWLRAVAKMNFNSKSIIAKIFYGFSAVVWLVSFIFGFLWDNVTTNDIFSRGITIIFVLLAIGYCVVGKDMIKALIAAKNSSFSHTKLIIKICLFISWYFCVAVGVATVYSIGILGPIFELMFTILFEGLALSGTFFILFFQPFKQKKKSSTSGGST